MKVLPLGILSTSDAAMRMCSILEVDGVTVDTYEAIVGGGMISLFTGGELSNVS